MPGAGTMGETAAAGKLENEKTGHWENGLVFPSSRLPVFDSVHH
jgi:hypothetical protein